METTTICGVSKTTITGWLSGLTAIVGGVLAYQIPTALLTPQVSHNWLWVTVAGQITLIILRTVMGILQGDAPKPS